MNGVISLRLHTASHCPFLSDVFFGGLFSASHFSPGTFRVIRSLLQSQHPQLEFMRQQNQTITTSGFCSQRELLIATLKSITRKTQLHQIHAQIVCTSLIQDSFISLRFLSCVALTGTLQDACYARLFFRQIPNLNVSHCNVMIRAYSMSDSPLEGFYIYRNMKRNGILADPVSSSFTIKSCVKMMCFVGGIQVHGRVLRDGHHSDGLLLTTLMNLYSQSGKCDDACKVFDEIPHRDTVAWNVLISCCLRNNRARDALSLFDIMQNEKNKCIPDDVTCLFLLQACAHLNAIEFGERIHCYIQDRGYDRALNLCNSLIAMYSRCGSLNRAFDVFRGMSNKNVVTWSSMISGLAVNGHGKEAIELFGEMQKMGIKPDGQTFTGALSACSHAGLVDEGLAFFDRMSKEFGITPNIHHYGCMVDLLGRAGLLDHAYQLILSMEVKPDPTIWRTLLGACRIKGHVALGECAIEHLIELKAQQAGDYVLLVNIYSSAGKWDKVAEIRKCMKDGSIQTSPGCSTIELRGVVHEFVVDDVSHPRKEEIYEKLDEINQQLKIAGYIAETKSELHKMDELEKGSALSYHSEKLAIAFGMLCTPPGTTLRVSKNLRTCADCHTFAKFVAQVYGRQIIIRDRTRFHHFQWGRCSCNDYW